MCDNCKNGLKVVDKDASREALTIIELVKKIVHLKNNITSKQSVDLLRGIKLQKVYIDPSIIEQFSGALKQMQEKDMRRIILQLLMKGILEEQFISTKI